MAILNTEDCKCLVSIMQSELQWTSLVKKHYHKDYYISNQHSTQEIFNVITLLHNPWIVKISKTVIVTKAVILPYLAEGESGLTNLYFSLQGINSTGGKKKNNGCMLSTMLLKARQSKML